MVLLGWALIALALVAYLYVDPHLRRAGHGATADVLGLRLNGWLAVVHLALGVYLIGMWDTARPGRALALSMAAFGGLGVLGVADDDGLVADWLVTSSAIGVFDLVVCIVVPILWIAGPRSARESVDTELTGGRHFAPDSDRAARLYAGSWPPLLGDFLAALLGRPWWARRRDVLLVTLCLLGFSGVLLPLLPQLVTSAGLGHVELAPKDCRSQKNGHPLDAEASHAGERLTCVAVERRGVKTEDVFGNELALALALITWPAVVALSGRRSRSRIFGHPRGEADENPDNFNWPLACSLVVVGLFFTFAANTVDGQPSASRGALWGLAFAGWMDLGALFVSWLVARNGGRPLYITGRELAADPSPDATDGNG